MPITNYNLAIDNPYQAGMIVTLDDAQIWTYANGTGAVLPFGLGVVKGTNSPGVMNGLASDIQTTATIVLPSASGQRFEGITYKTDTYELRNTYSRDAMARPGYPIGQPVSIVRRGVVAVYIDSAVDRGDPVFLRYSATAGGTGIVGCFRNDADTSKAMAIANASFIAPASAPAAGSMGIGLLELRSV